eukprot:8982071-Alexandrium_andersonii.AAC.1
MNRASAGQHPSNHPSIIPQPANANKSSYFLVAGIPKKFCRLGRERPRARSPGCDQAELWNG